MHDYRKSEWENIHESSSMEHGVVSFEEAELSGVSARMPLVKFLLANHCLKRGQNWSRYWHTYLDECTASRTEQQSPRHSQQHSSSERIQPKKTAIEIIRSNVFVCGKECLVR